MVSIHGKYIYVTGSTGYQSDGAWVDATQGCQGYAMHSTLVGSSISLSGTSPYAHLCEWVYLYNTGLDKSPVMSGSISC